MSACGIPFRLLGLAICLSPVCAESLPDWWDSVEVKLTQKENWYDTEETASAAPADKVAAARFQIKVFSELLRLHPKELARCAEGIIKIAQLYEELGDSLRALNYWKRLWTDYPPEKFPGYARVHKQAADAALKILGTENAPFEQAFWTEKWLASAGDDVAPSVAAERLLALGRAQTNLMRADEAVANLSAAQGKAKGNMQLSADIVFARAWALTAAGDTNQAVRIVSDHLGSTSSWSTQWYRAKHQLNALGTVEGNRAIPPESIEHNELFDEAVRLTESGRNDQALKEYLKIVEDFPTSTTRVSYRSVRGLTQAVIERIQTLPESVRDDYSRWVSSRVRRILRQASRDRTTRDLALAARYFGDSDKIESVRRALASLLMEQGRVQLARSSWPPLEKLLPAPAATPTAGIQLDASDGAVPETMLLPVAMNALTSEDVLRSRDAGHTFVPMLGVAADGKLFFHTLSEAYALDLKTGKLAWSYTAQRKTQEVPLTRRDYNYTLYEGQDLFKTATDGRTVIARHGYVAPSDQGLAYCLRAYDAETGRVLWSTEMDTEDYNFAASEARLVDGIVFFHEAQMEDEFRNYAVARDARSGKVLWRTELGSGMAIFRPDWWLRVDPRSKSAPPALRDGLLYSVTNFGAVYVLDALTGDFLWSVEYDREAPTDSNNSKPYIASQSDSPLLENNNLIFLPRDAKKVFCVDVKQRSMKWQLPVSNGAFIAGLADGGLIVWDGHLRCYDTDTLSLRWKSASEHPAAARPFINGKDLYCPTPGYLAKFSVGDGSLKGKYTWLKPGNLAAAGGSLIRFSLDSVDSLSAREQQNEVVKSTEKMTEPVISNKPFTEPFGLVWSEERNRARLIPVGDKLPIVCYAAEGRLFCESAGIARRLLWERPLRSTVYRSYATEDRIFLVTQSEVQCLNATNGDEHWNIRIPDMRSEVSRRITFDGDHIAFIHGEQQERVSLYLASSGKRLWEKVNRGYKLTEIHLVKDHVGVVGQAGSRAVQWIRFQMADGRTSTPLDLERAVKDVLVRTNGKTIIAVPLEGGVARGIDAEDGEELWNAELPLAPKDGRVSLRLTDDYLIAETPYDKKRKDGLAVVEIEDGHQVFTAPGGQSILKGDLLYRLVQDRVHATEYGMESDAWEAYLTDIAGNPLLLWAGDRMLVISSQYERYRTTYRVHDFLHVVKLKGARTIEPFLLPAEGYTGAVFAGGVLYVTTPRSVYALAPMSASTPDFAFEPVVSDKIYDATTMGSIAEMDGLMNEWRGTEPIQLKGKTFSADVYVRWDQANVYFAANVTDSRHRNDQSRQMLWRGDSIEIGIDSLHNDRTSIQNTFVDFRFTMGLGRNGAETFSSPSDAAQQVDFEIRRTTLGKTVYELALPWKLLRRDYRLRPGDITTMGFNVAANNLRDDGIVETVNWAHGLTGMADSKRYGQIRLQDLRPELLAEYRTLIDAVPNAPESWGLLRQILATFKGPQRQRLWIEEYESFVRKHPSSPHVSKALTDLERYYSAIEVENPRAACEKLIKSAGVSELEAGEYRGQKKFVQWVYLDPKEAVYEVMVEFKTAAGWTHRAFWGQDILRLGNPGTNSRRYAGPLPEGGNWHKLELPLNVIGLEDETLLGLGFNTWGGKVIFDHTAIVTATGEKVLIDDDLPTGFGEIDETWERKWKSWRWFKSPVHSGQKSHSSMPKKGEPHYYYGMQAVAEGRSLYEPQASAVQAASAGSIEVYRTAVAAIPGTKQGWSFFQKILDSFRTRDDRPGLRNELKQFITKYPDCANTSVALNALLEESKAAGEDGMAVCGEVIQIAKVSRRESLKFYSPLATPWTNWKIIGAFENTGGRRMKASMIIEKKLDEIANYMPDGTPAPDKPADEGDDTKKDKDEKTVKPVEWKSITASADGVVDLSKFISTGDEAIGYALARVDCPEKRSATLFLGAEETAAVLINGERLEGQWGGGAYKDANSVPIQLQKGVNTILLKIGTQKGSWRFIARVGHPDGRPMTDLKP